MRKIIMLVAFLLIVSGCSFKNGKVNSNPLPTVMATTIPELVDKQKCELELSGYTGIITTTMIIGSLIKDDGTVGHYTNILSGNAKPTTTVASELIFKDFIDNTTTLSGGFASIINASMLNNSKVELTIIKSSTTTVASSEYDSQKMKALRKRITEPELNKYFIIIAYVDYVITSNTFAEQGTEGGGSQFGVKVNGRWYASQGNTRVNHKIIALVSPLSLFFDLSESAASGSTVSPSGSANLPESVNVRVQEATKPHQ